MIKRKTDLRAILIAFITLLTIPTIGQQSGAGLPNEVLWMYDTARWGIGHHYIGHSDVLQTQSTAEWQHMTATFANDMVDYAERVAQTGAGYVIMFVTQNQGYCTVPSSVYDARLTSLGQSTDYTANVDLVKLMAIELKKHDIKTIVYTPFPQPHFLRGSTPQHHMEQWWLDFHGEKMRDWGDLIDGWWFDGYGTNYATQGASANAFWTQKMSDTLRHYNPNIAIAYSPGGRPGFGIGAGASHDTWEADSYYAAGERNIGYDLSYLLTASTNMRRVVSTTAGTNIQWHDYLYLNRRSDLFDVGWGQWRKNLHYTDTQISNHVVEAYSRGGVNSLDIALNPEGSWQLSSLKQIQSIGNAMGTSYDNRYSSLTLVNNDDPSINYSGTWTTTNFGTGTSSTGSYNQDVRTSTQNDASFTYVFNGSAIVYACNKTPQGGDVEIFIDNVSQGTFNTYYQYKTIPQRIIFEKYDLTEGSHTLRVEKRTGTSINVDLLAYGSPVNATTAPSAPSALTTAASSSSVDLSWTDNSNNESVFIIERKTGSGSFARVGVVQANSTSFTNTGLAELTEYTYRVRAANNIGESANSNESTVTTTSLGTNLALNKNATQSSTILGADASRAVDGDTNGNWGGNSVSHTDVDAQPWWQVDLGALGNISEVKIWNRTDCCGERLADYYVFAKSTPFTSSTVAGLLAESGVTNYHRTTAPSPSASINMNGLSARYIRIQKIGQDALNMAEVQVFGVTSTPAQGMIIVPTSISQTAGDALAGYDKEHMIDGSGLSSTPTVENLSTVTHTAAQSSLWVTASHNYPNNYFDNTSFDDPQFTIDLGGSYDLNSIVVWGYGGVTNEASNFTVEFSEDGGSTYGNSESVQTSSLLSSGNAKLDFSTTRRANWVRVTMTENANGRGFSGAGGDRVGLGEIRFVGTAVQVVNPGSIVTPTTIAQTAGDALAGYDKEHMIDGSGLSGTPTTSNLATITHTAAVSSLWVTQTVAFPNYYNGTNPSPQFTLDLGGSYDLTSIVVWGYGGVTNEASNFTVEFSEDNGSTYGNSELVQTSSLLSSGNAKLDFSTTRRANWVRVTMTENANGRGFAGAGGDRVGLGEIRFIGSAVAASRQVGEPQNEEIDEGNNERSIVLFPNPVDEVLQLSLRFDKQQKGIVEIFTIGGQRVLGRELDIAEGSNLLKIDVSRLNEGIYIVKGKFGSQTISQKVVIRKR